MTTVSIAPTPSQWASAARHFERRDDWRVYRVDGERYVALASGTSGRVYQVRADAAGCACPWYQKTGQQCSHALALELAALEAELTEAQSSPAPKPRKSYAVLFPKCHGCDDLADTRDGYCDRCASNREWQARRDQRAAS